MNNKALLVSLTLILLTYLPPLSAAPIRVKSIHWKGGSPPRLLIDFSALPVYRISRSADAGRLTIEVNDAAPMTSLIQPPAAHPAAARIGSLPGKAANSLRLLVELKISAAPKYRIEKLPEGARLVVEWPPAGPEAPKPAPTAKPKPARAFVVAIDAGHGGKDTGAIGPTGVLEKDVVLAIARKLAGLIRAEPGMRPVLVRSGDHFVDLRHRLEVARKSRADLFVSLHADAYVTGDVRGSSVFTLSEHGASSEAARWLADSENAALLGGVKLKDKGKMLASVLVDLSKNATLEASDKAAFKVLRELRRNFQIHHQEVQKAGFVVLKSLDVPSMLVETAFISNPVEERNLANPKHQDQLARAVFNGICAYRAETRPNTPLDVRMAEAEKN
jgi:N-acetylmuramoyl-L-alanine amidase